MLTQKRIDELEEIIAYTMGTCSFVVDLEGLTLEEMDYVDNFIFLCCNCAWWCDTGEMEESVYGEAVCAQCYHEEQEMLEEEKENDDE